MTSEEERRDTGLRRVPVQALVEICGRDVGGAPAFEAESLDVSGRGMHLRTAYLPEIGSPLVCRFDNGGNEIVVEGVVAWNHEEERGGEFGIQFTALDSGSVEALKQLCFVDESDAPPADAESPAGKAVPEGARVRLHIDGLGSPMKACVRAGSRRDVHVASNLEFLKVGRHLEIEDLTQGARRGAQIDGVDVVIDPQTRVPQLVVALRYDVAAEATPEPSVIDSSSEAEDGVGEVGYAAAPGFAAGVAGTGDEGETISDDDILGDEDEVVEEAQAMRGKLANMAVGAGAAAKRGGVLLGNVGTKAAGGMGRFFKGAGAKMMELKQRRALENAPRRTTAAPPGGAMSAVGRRLRPQSGAVDAEIDEPIAPDPAQKKRRAKKIAALSALGVLLLTVGVIAMKKPSQPPGAEKAKEAAASVAVAATGPQGDVKQVDEQGNPIGAPGPAPAGSVGGTSAEVPLFGPTPMATMEPAPLGPAPADDDQGGDANADDQKDEEAKEKAAASASVDDQSFDDDGAKKGDTGPWGRGELVEPTVHRLRLDKPGTAIQGAVNATGFAVVLPGVKVMESPKGIMKRDSRIAKVRTQNSSSGAEISFQFKDGIPAYRVRLKKDYVEFLVSAAGKGGKATASSTGGHKKHHKKHSKSGSKASKASTGGKKSAKKKSKKKG
jgi:PilZ domain